MKLKICMQNNEKWKKWIIYLSLFNRGGVLKWVPLEPQCAVREGQVEEGDAMEEGGQYIHLSYLASIVYPSALIEFISFPAAVFPFYISKLLVDGSGEPLEYEGMHDVLLPW